MNFVKKNLKWIITIIGVMIVTTGISVYATGQYLASQVDYNKNGQAKVSDALDDLYNKASNYKYTEQQYQDYGITQYNKGKNDNIKEITNFTYDYNNGDWVTVNLGFRPNFVFLKSNPFFSYFYDGDTTWSFASRTTSSSGSNYGSIDVTDNGFKYKINSNMDGVSATGYAVK